MTIFQCIAHQQDRVVFLPIRYSELVHDPAIYANKLVLCFLSEQRDFDCIDWIFLKGKQAVSCHNLDGSGGRESCTIRNFTVEQKIITLRHRKTCFR
ncbi:hypothetical protein D3C85_1114890 [compost metagenome]